MFVALVIVLVFILRRQKRKSWITPQNQLPAVVYAVVVCIIYLCLPSYFLSKRAIIHKRQEEQESLTTHHLRQKKRILKSQNNQSVYLHPLETSGTFIA